MIPEVGQFALIMAFCLALMQGMVPLFGVMKQKPAWMSVAKPCAILNYSLIVFAYGCLAYAFLTNDFSVSYVAGHSAIILPWYYKVGALWGGHEGSLILWLLMMNTWVMVMLFWQWRWNKNMPKDLLASVLSVMGLVNVGFLAFLLSTSNPFARVFEQVSVAGQDLNPLLQDPGLLLHPPMLYLGYVGYGIVFAFAIAALITGRVDQVWARYARPWALFAWLSLTMGIALGSWWAYHVLGWGGWWFWDPVENASVLPWFTGTALIHSFFVTEKRGALQSWTLFLSILCFALSLLGTFLVRSGVLISVHAFASDPSRGVFLLMYMFLVILIAFMLFAWRGPKIKQIVNFQLLSKEATILYSNVLLLVIMVSVMLGTLYPLILDVLGLGKLSVGEPYFNAVFVPLALPVFLLMGVGPLCMWQQMSAQQLLQKLWVLLALAMILGIAISYAAVGTVFSTMVLGIGLALWVMLTAFKLFYQSIQYRGLRLSTFVTIPASQYGMLLAHIGVALCIIGVSVVSHLSAERDVRIAQGEHVQLADYDFHFTGINEQQGANYQSQLLQFTVSNKQGEHVTHLQGEKRIYTINRVPMSQAAIKSGLWRDLYIAVGDELEPKVWSVRLYYKPFIRWIWLGALLMMLGGLLAVCDKRYRDSKQHKQVEASHV